MIVNVEIQWTTGGGSTISVENGEPTALLSNIGTNNGGLRPKIIIERFMFSVNTASLKVTQRITVINCMVIQHNLSIKRKGEHQTTMPIM